MIIKPLVSILVYEILANTMLLWRFQKIEEAVVSVEICVLLHFAITFYNKLFEDEEYLWHTKQDLLTLLETQTLENQL